MSQYFENDADVKNEEFKISFKIKNKSFVFTSNHGVFSKKRIDKGSEILINSILEYNPHGRILDLGCGIGVVGLTLATFDKNKYVLADVNKRAVELCNKNCINLNLSSRCEILESDIFENIKDIFDYILLNPPIRAGKKVIYKMYQESYEHLNSGGSLFIVIRVKQGALSSYKFLLNIYKEVKIINKDKGYQIIQCVK